MREMFDAIAPRYDLVNRIMTFRLDVRWRRRAVRSLALPDGQPRPRPGQRHRRPLRRPGRRRATARSRSTSASGCCGRPQRRAPGAGRHPPPPGARRLRRRRRRAGSPCATSSTSAPFFDELGRVVRPGGRIALLDVGDPPQRARPLGPRRSTSARSCPASAGWLSDPAAYRYLPRSVAYLPPAAEHAGHAAAVRVRRRHPRRAQRRHHPAPRRHPRPLMRAVTRLADDATAALDLSDIARGDGYLFVRDGVGLAGRGVAARASTDEMPALLASIEHDDRTGGDDDGVPGGHRLGAVRPGAAGRADRAGGRRSARRPTAAGWSPSSTTPSSACPRRRRRARRRRRYTIAPVTPDRPLPRRRGRRPATPCATVG